MTGAEREPDALVEAIGKHRRDHAGVAVTAVTIVLRVTELAR